MRQSFPRPGIQLRRVEDFLHGQGKVVLHPPPLNGIAVPYRVTGAGIAVPRLSHGTQVHDVFFSRLEFDPVSAFLRAYEPGFLGDHPGIVGMAHETETVEPGKDIADFLRNSAGQVDAIGKALVMGMEEFHIPRKRVSEEKVEGEISSLGRASASAKKEFEVQLGRVSRKGAGIAQILKAHLGMLADPKLHDDIVAGIRKSRHSAPYAVTRVFRRKIKALEDTGSPYFVSVIRDLAQIEKTLLRALLGKEDDPREEGDESFLLIAHDLSPAETLSLDRENLLGLVTEIGGPTSHTAIVASSLGIPAVVGI